MRTITKIIGKNIKIARIKKDWSQAELAHRLNVEQSYVSRIESGTIAISFQRIYEIIIILDCDINEIFPSISDIKKSI